jgi:NAD(P)-dependent dehydrogenase (short-subunit alcohol dehydrogenase family)
MIKSMENAFCLDGKTAVVTGGNRGIGLGIADALAHQGANVAIICRNTESAKKAVSELQSKYSGKFAYYRADVSDFDACKDAVASAIKDFGRIDILVNNSGIAAGGRLLDMEEGLPDYHRCININLFGAINMSYLIGRHMRDNGIPGRIINISSNSGEMVNKPQVLSPYNVAKAGLNRFTKCLAHELAGHGIRVNAIAPGYTYSTLTEGLREGEFEMLLEKIPIGRFGEPAEIGALAVYLASEASDLMTGAVLTIDGGYSLAI